MKDQVQFSACFSLMPPGGYVLQPADHFSCSAAGTPYEGGLFKMKLVVGSEFPQAPPKGELCCS